MAAKVTITSSAKTIELNEKIITNIGFEMRTPEGSNARSYDQTFLLTIKGRIIAELGGSSGEVVNEINQWSLVNIGPDVYRKVTAEHTGENMVMRHYDFDKAHVVKYDEDLNEADGTGTFELVLAQKKDHNKSVKVNGAYPV